MRLHLPRDTQEERIPGIWETILITGVWQESWLCGRTEPHDLSALLCRYVICKGLKLGIDDVRDYLFMVNIRLNQLRNSDVDVNLVVPLNVIKGDQDFYDYIVQSNEK